MQGGKRKPSTWNIFVKKIYNEGKAKNANYSFKKALSDASARKSEMKSMKQELPMVKKSRKHYKKSSRKSSHSGGKSRKHRKH